MGQPAKTPVPIASKAKSESRFIVVLQTRRKEGKSAAMHARARRRGKTSKRRALDKVAPVDKRERWPPGPIGPVKRGSRGSVTACPTWTRPRACADRASPPRVLTGAGFVDYP